MALPSSDQTPEPSVTDEVFEWLEESDRRYKAYLRTRRRIVWDRELTAAERQELLRALKAAYEGDGRVSCDE